MASVFFDKNIISSYKILDAMPSNNIATRSLKDILPYIGSPSMDIEYYDVFIGVLNDEAKKLNILDHIKEILGKAPDCVLGNIKKVICVITYPVTNPAIIEFTINVNLNYGVLLYLYTVAYQIMYGTEECDDEDPGFIDGMFNRNSSYGRFGIWGHVINDLIYNSSSKLNVHQDYVIFEADCDS